MSEESFHTIELHDWLDRDKAGDPQALDGLLKRVSARLDRLARKMLKRFPRIARWTDAEDVLQSASIRLIRALESVRPGSVRDFYALASLQIRRELLDLVKRFYGPFGEAAHHASINQDGSSGPVQFDAAGEDERELEQWRQFHEEVERLPPEERETVGLIFYHGWKQDAVAQLFGVTVRTIQRWWRDALEKLRASLSDESVAG